MEMSERDEIVWKEIQAFEDSILSYEVNDLENLYEKWITRAFTMLPDTTVETFFNKLDTWLFHLNSFIQGASLQNDAREQILNSGRIFDNTIQTIPDLKQLTIDQVKYIAEQNASRHRVYSFIQGGMSGTGHSLLLGTDFLGRLVINLRSVQLIAMSYGYDVQIPFEMMTSLKVFHSAALPNRLKGHGWSELMKDLDEKDQHSFFYEGSEKLTDIYWLEDPLKQMLKVFLISSFSKKKLSGIPLLSMGICAGSNYRYARKVTEFAHKYYQYRYLLDKHSF